MLSTYHTESAQLIMANDSTNNIHEVIKELWDRGETHSSAWFQMLLTQAAIICARVYAYVFFSVRLGFWNSPRKVKGKLSTAIVCLLATLLLPCPLCTAPHHTQATQAVDIHTALFVLLTPVLVQLLALAATSSVRGNSGPLLDGLSSGSHLLLKSFGSGSLCLWSLILRPSWAGSFGNPSLPPLCYWLLFYPDSFLCAAPKTHSM